jgi:hypothetical protein
MQPTLDDLLVIDVHSWKDKLDHQTFSSRWYLLGELIAEMPVVTAPDLILVDKRVIELTYTSCHLGGKRPWFMCPDCNSRRSKLYWDDGFFCRTCLRLPYASTLETEMRRVVRKQARIDEKLCQKMRKEKRKHLEAEWLSCNAYLVDDYNRTFGGPIVEPDQSEPKATRPAC